MTRAEALARRQDAIRHELVADPCRPTTAIAKKVHSAPATVRAVRRELEHAGTIPRRARRHGCWQPDRERVA
ncbi:hypothetical protein WDY80_05115 [Gordonia hongkongensis]|uniref:hypothetical protein n=1 Tax=Gordonia hongkongensis TaxID=1701090 RepID=UPI0030CF2A62